MNSFVIKRQPLTFNSWKKASATKKNNYKTLIQTAFRQFNTENILTNELYGAVYHFYNKNENIDADNLSKPLWDCLKGFLYNDDEQIKIRIAGSFDLSKNDFNILNFSGLSGDVIIELLESFDIEEHIVYVECGTLNYSNFKFNIEKNGN